MTTVKKSQAQTDIMNKIIMDLFIFSKTLINIVYQIKLIFCYFDKEYTIYL